MEARVERAAERAAEMVAVAREVVTAAAATVAVKVAVVTEAARALLSRTRPPQRRCGGAEARAVRVASWCRCGFAEMPRRVEGHRQGDEGEAHACVFMFMFMLMFSCSVSK